MDIYSAAKAMCGDSTITIDLSEINRGTAVFKIDAINKIIFAISDNSKCLSEMYRESITRERFLFEDVYDALIVSKFAEIKRYSAIDVKYEDCTVHLRIDTGRLGARPANAVESSYAVSDNGSSVVVTYRKYEHLGQEYRIYNVAL